MNPVTAQFGNLLYLGAGSCPSVTQYSEIANKVYLVEAQPVLANQLRTDTAVLENVTVIEAIIAAESQPAVFQDYNLRWAASLALPAGLKKIYPSLTCIAERNAETQAVTQLVTNLALSDQQPNALIIDLPGQELELLEALAAQQQLQSFDEILLISAKDGVYDPDHSAAPLIAWCASHAYAQGHNTPLPTPQLLPWQALYSLRLDRTAATNQRLETALKKQQQDMEQINTRLQQADNNNETLSHQLAELQQQLLTTEQTNAETLKQRDQLKTQLDAANTAKNEQQARAEQQAKQRDELNQKLQTADQANAEAVKQRDQLKSQLDTVNNDMNAQQAQIENLTIQLTTADTTNKALLQQRDELNQKLQTAEQTNAEADRQRDQFKSQLDTANTSKSEQQFTFQHQSQLQQQKIEELEQQFEEKNFRNQLIDKEMIKAEAQIDLIKDILIREKAF
tara:strand:- start:6506 stop:7864 length:1359 start_codon:yes stop_codon:yes gene_type:complete